MMLATLFLITLAWDDITVEAPIKEVTVFSDRALVSRTVAIKLDAGQHQLRFEGFSDKINQKSVQVRGTGTATLTEIRFEDELRAELSDQAWQGMQDEMEGLEIEMEDRNDALELIKAEIAFLWKISEKVTHPSDKDNASSLDPEQWKSLATYLYQRQDTLTKQRRELKRSSKQKEERLDELENLMDELGFQPTQLQHHIIVSLDVPQTSTITLDLSYLIDGPMWFPSYDLRMDSTRGVMEVSYHAKVRQATGESWQDVTLKLSTAQPQFGAAHDDLVPWELSFAQPEYEPIAEYITVAGDVSLENKAEFMTVTATPRRVETPDVDVDTAMTSVVFTIPGKSTILPDNKSRKVTILRTELAAETRYSTVPKLERHVYLKAKMTNDSGFPFLNGDTNIFLDGHYVAPGLMGFVPAGGAFWTFLGVDEQMDVSYHKRQLDDHQGMFGKKIKRAYAYDITLTNNKKTPQNCSVWDQIPRANHRDITVKLEQPEINGTDIMLNEHDFIQWFVTLQPGEKRTLPLRYWVSYPADQHVDGL